MKKSHICFVIMSFQEKYILTYEKAIRPAVKDAADYRKEKWSCLRSDEIRVPGSITKEIVTSLHTADLVIADLTGHNPNVFYELGVVHSAGRPTIMITQQLRELPFDINTYRVHEYTPSDDGLSKLHDFLYSTILDVWDHRKSLTNPVLDFAPVRHAHIILSLEDVIQLEKQVTNEVWVIEPSFDTDLKILGELVRHTLERKIKYRYLVPRTRGVLKQWERLVNELKTGQEDNYRLEVRTVEPHFIESEVVIYDPFSPREEVLIMSPREQESLFWYRVGKTRGEVIRDRYQELWDNVSKPIDEPI